MFNTIKSKIVLITILMLIALSILLLGFSYLYMKSGKRLIIVGCSHSITVFAKNINKEIVKIENNAKDLALQGEMFYKIDKDRTVAERAIIRLFENYEASLGGGIWFEPYALVPDKRLFCIYAFRNHLGNIVIDNEFETENYDYPNQSWYREIMPKLTKENNIEWSKPYYEKEGSDTLMVTAGSGIYADSKLVGLSTVDWEISSIIKSVSKMKPTPNSFALFADKDNDCIIASNDPYLDNANLMGKSLSTIPWYNDNLKVITYFDYQNKKYIPYVKTLDNGMILIVVVPKHELFRVLYKHVFILFAGLMFICLIIALLLYVGLIRYIKTPIEKLTELANRVGQGELNTKIIIEKPEEFANLAKTFNKMATDIKSITKERERIESELALAKAIQLSSLPNVFPPFPDNNEFEIYAGMEPAKEVGGDFYDFYFTDENHFMFLIADVSGKGVPAALFMMTAKTLINYVAQADYEPEQMIEIINKKICSNNKQGFFITLFAGIVDVNTGELTCINCGHNPPMIKKSNEPFRYEHLDSNIVLGAFDDARYNVSKTVLDKGDIIILYTDGITEAIDENGEFFGEERLLQTANSVEYSSVKELQLNIKQQVKEFTKGMAQSDDMTMLVFKFNSDSAEKDSYKGIALKTNYKEFLNWLEQRYEKYNIENLLRNKIMLVSEELYTNRCSYAYPDKEGVINAEFICDSKSVVIRFSDEGIPFNPLLREDPDVELPPQSREQGGLGIFIVKNTSDEVNYEYKDNKNILTVKFNL